MVALALAAVKIEKGKFPITKLANWLTNRTFNKNSSIKTAMNGFYDVLKRQNKKVIQDFQHALVHGDVKKFLDKPENKALKDAAKPLTEEFAKIGKKGIKSVFSGENKKGFTKTFTELFKSHLKQSALAKWTRSMLAQGSKLWARNKVRNAFDTYDMARVIKKSLKELPPELKQGLSKLSTSDKLKALSNRFADAKTNPALKELVKIIEKSPEKLNNIINNAEKMSEYEIEKEIKFYIRGLEEKLGTNVTYKNYKTLFNTGIVAGVPVLGVIFGIPYAFNAWLTNIQKKAGKIGIMKAMDKIDDPRVFASEQPADKPTEQQAVTVKSSETNLLKNLKN